MRAGAMKMIPMGRTTASAMAAASSSYQAHISELAASIRPPPRVLVTTSSRGSGHHGESDTVAFWTIDELPEKLLTIKNHTNDHRGNESEGTCGGTPLKRTDIDELGPDRLAFWIDNVLTHPEADALAACAEAVLEHNGHSRMAPGIHTPLGMRINEAAHWYPSYRAAPVFLGAIFDRIQHLVPTQVDDNDGAILPLYPRLSEKVAQFKYNEGDRFNRHVDGLFPGQGANKAGTGIEEWDGVVSGFSMLFYLNDYETDGLQGGETRLWSADGRRHVDVQPKKGRVLFFRRGSPTAVVHAGMPVTGPVPKYMALINLAYGKRVLRARGS